MARWDKDNYREDKGIDKLFKYSLLVSIGFFGGMALVIFFG